MVTRQDAASASSSVINASPAAHRAVHLSRAIRVALLSCIALLASLFAVPGALAAPAAIPPSTLVNNPAADEFGSWGQDTQSDSSITIAGPNLVAAFSDTSSTEVAHDYKQATGYAVSTDGGRTWVDKGRLPHSFEGDGGDPVLATDTSSGRVYLTVGPAGQEGRNVQVFRSNDNGLTFGAPVIATPGLGVDGTSDGFRDEPWVAVDNYPGPGQGNVYLSWAQVTQTAEGVRFTRSTDGGSTWGPNKGTTIAPSEAAGSYVVVTPDHCVHVFYLSGISRANIMKVRKSCDQGVTFGPAVTITDLRTTGERGDLSLEGGFEINQGAFDSNAFPQASVNPVTGTLYVTYNDTTAGKGVDVFLKSSSNGGATWSAPVRINTDRTANDQFFPTVAVSQDGRALMVSWYDRRADPANLDVQRFSRQAAINPTTGALTFKANLSLSPSFPLVSGQDDVTNRVGQYDQIVADRTNFYVTWTDNRDGNAVHANQPDIRFARILINARTGA